MRICPADRPELGERVLYVEQAQVEALNQPYRQRLYVVEPGDSDDVAVSRIFTFLNASGAVGACDGPARMPRADVATEKEGCAVTLTWDGTRFEGGTTGTDCATDLGGDYADSRVTLTETELRSWDRGFYQDGTQAWGVQGGPYVFVRRTPVPAE